jgi:BirA family biotin operon repressor/biotin-[acetyl-CoA-carboxylase] ligase
MARARYLRGDEAIETRRQLTARTGSVQPIRAAAVSQELIRPGALWQQIRVVEVTGSTNADLLAEAAAGAPGGRVLVAEAQTAGRGRLGRQWVSPPRASLTFSVLVRPDDLPPPRRAWIPLLAGVAVASALNSSAAVDACLKWPNDVLVGGAKLAGILAEQYRDAIVVGVGINVTVRRADLPAATATSLLLENAAVTDRERLLAAVLRELEHWYLAWTGTSDPESSGLRAEYLRRCVTIGRQVRVEMPGGRTLAGLAADVDAGGRLVVRTASGVTSVSAGDVVHVR